MKVNWLGWGEEAFSTAREQDKPILLSISATWCHWCHVMDELNYSNSDVSDFINQNFVPVRVDNDKRPDINRRYNLGGWPTTAFLTPTGELLIGDTFIPPDNFKSLLAEVKYLYNTHKDVIYEKIARYKEKEEKIPKEADYSSIVEQIAKIIKDKFDSSYGGFGREPKFPQPEIIDFLLARHYFTREPVLEEIITKTLDTMEQSNMYDREENGFFRYSITRDWSVPHYEKMLEVNVSLLKNYLTSWQEFGRPSYLETSKGIITYLKTKLFNSDDNIFYGSQDADEQYYLLDLKKRTERKAPAIDHTVFTDWNALADLVFLEASSLLPDEELSVAALKNLAFLWEHLFTADKGMYHYYTEEKFLAGLLKDNVLVSLAYLKGYEATGKKEFLNRSVTLADYVLEHFYDEEKGGFFDRVMSQEFGYLAKREKDFNDNAQASSLFIRLYRYTNKEDYYEKAKATLLFLASLYKTHSTFSASYGLALLEFLNPPLKLTIIGKNKQNLLREANLLYYPWKIIRCLSLEDDAEEIKQMCLDVSAEGLVYACFGKKCYSPTDNLQEIFEQMKKDLFSVAVAV